MGKTRTVMRKYYIVRDLCGSRRQRFDTLKFSEKLVFFFNYHFDYGRIQCLFSYFSFIFSDLRLPTTISKFYEFLFLSGRGCYILDLYMVVGNVVQYVSYRNHRGAPG